MNQATDRPRFTVTDAPAGTSTLVGAMRAVLRRFLSRLPTALALLATTNAFFRIDYIDRAIVGVNVTTDWWKINLVCQAVFVLCIVLGVVAADEAVARGARRWSSYAVALIAACAVGSLVQAKLLGWIGWVPFKMHVPELAVAARPLQLFFYALAYGTFGCFVYVHHRTAKLAELRMQAAELARATSRRRTLESRLQAMQARIEPHFLFNTLAHVRDLHEHDSAAAGQMLDDLITYLRAALPHLRESSSTLGREIDLARAYLDIVRVRLDDGLAVEIELSHGLIDARVPAMIVLPLIDHALARRVRDNVSGGAIRIEGEMRAGRLHLAIDNRGGRVGAARREEGPPGIADRLSALYGSNAHFDFDCAADGSTRAHLDLPYEADDVRHR